MVLPRSRLPLVRDGEHVDVQGPCLPWKGGGACAGTGGGAGDDAPRLPAGRRVRRLFKALLRQGHMGRQLLL